MAGGNRLFTACVVSLVATSFGFISRALLLNTLGREFNLTDAQMGALSGAGLFPFAVSIIFFSLIVDRVGYGRAMAFAWLGHAASGIMMIFAKDFTMLYLGTLLFALANGTVEAVVNPVTASLYSKNKTHYLNILHSGWPAGLVLGGLLFMLLGDSVDWRVKLALYLIPTAAYGIMMLGQSFPQQERVSAGVTFDEMVREFGWAGFFIIGVFVTYAVDSVCVSLGAYEKGIEPLTAFGITAAPTLLFALRYRSYGRPMFVFLLLIMVLLATTELGTDSWVSSLMEPVLKNANAGNLVLIYTSAIMFILRFFAGPIVHRISPLGLLSTCSLLAAGGLCALSAAGSSGVLIFAAATLYGVGKSFFWPTTLGVVSEQFPRGGALTLNAIGGLGMISAGILGGPLLGAMQDSALDQRLHAERPALHAKVTNVEKSAYLLTFKPVEKSLVKALPEPEQKEFETIKAASNQQTLLKMAIFPALMFVAFLSLILYFRSRGGYKPVDVNAR